MAIVVPNFKNARLKYEHFPFIGRLFSPSALFANGEVGVWYDPSPETTFTDTAGTAPATVGDAVARINDLSGNGHNATQATTAARPILARVPARGRANLLTRTEEFDDAAWILGPSGTGTVTKSTANAASAPDGTMTADRVLFSLNGGTTSSDIALLRQGLTLQVEPATHSVYLRSFDGVSSYVMQIIAPDGSGQNITVTGEWQRFSVTATAPNFNINYGVRLRGGQSPANSDSADILIWGAQVELGSTASAYQKVTSTYDVTEAGQADNWYLFDDIVDDAINWTAPTDTYSIAYISTGGAVTILEGQALSGATDVLQASRTGSYIAADRAWTADEKANITTYLENKGAGL